MAKILLVGTDESVEQMYADILTASGFDVVIENSARDGLDRLSDDFFPACVVALDREECLWFLTKVRRVHSVKVSAIPILVLLDENTEKYTEFYDAGATKCISRFPASGDQLIKELRSILNIPRVQT